MTIPRATVFWGHTQAGCSGRATVVFRGAVEERDLAFVCHSSGGYHVQGTLTRARDSELARALARRGVTVAELTLPPLPNEELVLAVGDVVTARARPIPSVLPRDGLTILVGSCLYAHHRDKLESLARAVDAASGPVAARGDWTLGPAQLGLWLGDNVYLDVHPRWAPRDPFAHVAEQYAHLYAQSPSACAVLSRLPTLSLVDDHDLYDGFPERQPHLPRTWLPWIRSAHERAAMAGIELFQTARNPPRLGPDAGSFTLDLPPLSCFMLDTRGGRTRLDRPSPRLTSETELGAFERWVAALRAPGVLALAQPLLLPGGTWHEPSPPQFRAQFERLLRALRDAPHDILVLAGDLHTSRLLELDVGGRRVFELVSSPLVRIPSFLTNLVHRAGLTRREDQEPEQIRVPRTHELVPGAISLRCREYVMGSAAANSFALVELRPLDEGRIGVCVELCDHTVMRRAACEGDAHGRRALLAPGLPCHWSFELGAREAPWQTGRGSVR